MNRNHRVSYRLKGWDYARNGAYYITIVTKNRQWFFGEIISAKMVLSEVGAIAQQCWYEIPRHFPFVRLGAFIVMPDHIHGIVIIDKRADAGAQDLAPLQDDSGVISTIAGAQDLAPLRSGDGKTSMGGNRFGPQSRNLGSIVRGYKIGVTKGARLIGKEFGWHWRYHDCIIRNSREYARITWYIRSNPARWKHNKQK